jgi:hypothetical protein
MNGPSFAAPVRRLLVLALVALALSGLVGCSLPGGDAAADRHHRPCHGDRPAGGVGDACRAECGTRSADGNRDGRSNGDGDGAPGHPGHAHPPGLANDAADDARDTRDARDDGAGCGDADCTADRG